MSLERERRTDAEFFVLSEKLGIDPGCCVNPRTAFVYATGRRACRDCMLKERCRQMLFPSPVGLSLVASFCPNRDVLTDLLYRQPVRYAAFEK